MNKPKTLRNRFHAWWHTRPDYEAERWDYGYIMVMYKCDDDGRYSRTDSLEEQSYVGQVANQRFHHYLMVSYARWIGTFFTGECFHNYDCMMVELAAEADAKIGYF